MRGITHKFDGRRHKSPPKHERQKPTVAHGYSLQSAASQSSGGPDQVPDNSNLASRDYRIDPPDKRVDERAPEFSITAYGNKPPGYDLQGEGGPQIHDTWMTAPPIMGRVIRNEDAHAPSGLPSRGDKNEDKVQVGFRFRQSYKGV